MSEAIKIVDGILVYSDLTDRLTFLQNQFKTYSTINYMLSRRILTHVDQEYVVVLRFYQSRVFMIYQCLRDTETCVCVCQYKHLSFVLHFTLILPRSLLPRLHQYPPDAVPPRGWTHSHVPSRTSCSFPRKFLLSSDAK